MCCEYHITAVSNSVCLLVVIVTDPDQQVSCVTRSFLASGCSLDALAPCVCTNVSLLKELSGCVQSSCKWQDQLGGCTTAQQDMIWGWGSKLTP